MGGGYSSVYSSVLGVGRKQGRGGTWYSVHDRDGGRGAIFESLKELRTCGPIIFGGGKCYGLLLAVEFQGLLFFWRGQMLRAFIGPGFSWSAVFLEGVNVTGFYWPGVSGSAVFLLCY